MKRKFFLKNLVIFLVPLLVPVLILGTLAIVITQQNIQGEINRSNLNLFQQIDRSIELIFKEMDSLGISFGDPVVVFRLEEILRTQTLTLENLRLIENTKNYISAPANARPYIESIYVYIRNPHGQFLSSVQGLTRFDRFYDTDWFDNYDPDSEQRDIWIESRNIRRYSFEEPFSVTTVYKFLYSTVSDRPNGLIALNFYTDYIEQLLQEAEKFPDQYIIVQDETGRVLFSNRQLDPFHSVELSELSTAAKGETFTLETDTNIYIGSYYDSELYGWKYLSLVPRQSLNAIPNLLGEVTIYVVLISFALGLALTYVVTRRYVNNIRNIISTIKTADQDPLLPVYPDRVKEDEYGFIIRRILQNYIEQKNLQLEVSEKKYKLKETELIALQNQINPHFLFNTMETINWKVLSFTGRPNEANRMIEQLSDLLKYSLETGQSIVPLEKELEMTKNYIAIQNVRYRDKFEVIFDYDPQHLRFGTIKFLLQPLLENSIYHGIQEKDGRSGIKIKVIHHADHHAEENAQFLEIAVIDNGKGMDKEKLARVRERLQNEEEDGSNVGLSNIYKRLYLTYGRTDLLVIRSKADWGTVVSVKIPL